MTTAKAPPAYVREYPNGIKIAFYDGNGPARRYLISCPEQGIEEEKFTSVTTITGVYDKPALKYAAQKIGVEGAIALAQDGFLPPDADAAIGMMKKRKLCFWDIWGQKADWGTLAHGDLVSLAAGELADLDTYPPKAQGFVRGISAWMADYSPKVLEAEVPVASIKHRFAGRFDWLVEFDLPFIQGRAIVDLKSTDKLPLDKHRNVRPPYEEHAVQVRLYDIAARECCFEPTDFQAILRVDSTGQYDFTVSWVDDQAALDCVAGHRGMAAVRGGGPK